ncbi:hypothetical protein H1R20_g15012, partial [Candolleomyces eurysporus]
MYEIVVNMANPDSEQISITGLVRSIQQVFDTPPATLLRLMQVDWSIPSRGRLRDEAIDALLKLMAVPLDISDGDVLVVAGLSLQVLGMMPRNTAGERIKLMPSSLSITRHLLVHLNDGLDHPDLFFPADEYPASISCSLAASIAIRLFVHDQSLFSTTDILSQLVALAYKVWCWAGIQHGRGLWCSMKWDLAYCAEEGTRWLAVTSWLEGRCLMLYHHPGRDLCSLAVIIKIVLHFCRMSTMASKLVIESRTPHICVKLLNLVPTVTNYYLTTCASLIHALGCSLEAPAESEYMQTVRRLLRSGVLSVVRDVILYADNNTPRDSYSRSWFYLRFLISCSMDHATIAVLYRSFTSLPPILDQHAKPQAADFWKSVVSTLKLFADGHRMFVNKTVGGICDNMTCTAEGVTPKCCDKCKNAIYCGEACQTLDWRSSHKYECELFNRDILPRAKVKQNTKIYLLHVLAFIALDADSTLQDFITRTYTTLNPDQNYKYFPVFHVGPSPASSSIFRLDGLRLFIQDKPVPANFIKMINIVRDNVGYKFAALAIADEGAQRVYLFALMRVDIIENKRVFIPVKGMEVTGVDAFFQPHAN